MTWQDQVHCYINISCHLPSVLRHIAAGKPGDSVENRRTFLVGSWGQQVIKMRSASVKTKKPYPELTKESIHKESEYLSAGGACYVLCGNLRTMTIISQLRSSSSHKNSFLSQTRVSSGSLVTIFSNTRVMPSNGFCDWFCSEWVAQWQMLQAEREGDGGILHQMWDCSRVRSGQGRGGRS